MKPRSTSVKYAGLGGESIQAFKDVKTPISWVLAVSKKKRSHVDRQVIEASETIPTRVQGGRADPAPMKPPADIAAAPVMRLRQHRLFLIILGLAILAGTALFYQTTNQGLGVLPDSMIYLSVARNVLHGYGFTHPPGTPLTHYPPLYPAALALAGIPWADPVEGARWLHLIVYLANLSLVGLLIYRGTNGSVIAGACGLFFMLLSRIVGYRHALLLSEPLFIFFTLGALILLNEYFQYRRMLILAAACITIGLACLTRYVGYALIPAGIILILVFNCPRYFKLMVVYAFILSICTIGVLAYFISSNISDIIIGNRHIIFHMITMAQAEQLINITTQWFFVPSTLPLSLKTILLISISVLAVLLFMKTMKNYGLQSPLVRIPLMCAIFLFSYFCLLVVTILFVEAMLPFDNRILFPFLVVLVICLVSLCKNALTFANIPKWFALSAFALATMFLLVQGREMIEVSAQCGEIGIGYAGRAWKVSKTVGVLKQVPKDTLIYSNAPDAIDFLLDRQAMMIPRKQNSTTRQVNADFQNQMEEMVQRLRTTQGVLAYFRLVKWRWYHPSIEEIQKYGEFQPLYEGPDGVIYRVAGSGN